MRTSPSRTRKRATRTLCLTAIAAMALPGSAWADQIVNTLDNSIDPTRETLQLTVPNSGSTTVYVNPTNDLDGEPSCNLQGKDESVTFSVESSNSSVATVSPSSITFNNCGDTRAVTVTAVAQGPANITFTRKSSTGVVGTFDPAPANFAVNVSPAPVIVPPNAAPTINGGITGLTSVNEGDSGTYGVSAIDPDGDPLTYVWTITGGNAVINGASNGSSVDVDFTDGPSTVGLKVEVSDGNGHVVARALSITEHNVAPTVVLSGAVAALEGDTKSYSYSVSDPGNDTVTATPSCGAASFSNATATGFDCTFPDNGSYTVSVSADDGDSVNNTGSASKIVTVANVNPSFTNWSLTGADGTACIGGNTVSLSFDVTDPANEAHDPITGSAFNPFSGRSVSQTKVFPAGTWSQVVTANDGDGGTATQTASGSFLYSTTGGFPLAPINTDGSSNFKLGSTIPVKLRIVDCQGQPVAGLAPQINLVKTSSIVNGTVNEPVDTVSVPDDGKTMRYDAAAGQYIYNLSTKRSIFAAGGGALDLGRYTLSINGSGIAAPPSVGFDILK